MGRNRTFMPLPTAPVPGAAARWVLPRPVLRVEHEVPGPADETLGEQLRYTETDWCKARSMMHKLADGINVRPVNAPAELDARGRTHGRRLRDVLAHFDHEFSSNESTRRRHRLEHLRGIALGFANLDNYIARSLLHAVRFKQTT